MAEHCLEIALCECDQASKAERRLVSVQDSSIGLHEGDVHSLAIWVIDYVTYVTRTRLGR